MQLPVADRTVQVYQQTCGGRGKQRRVKGARHLLRQFQRARVPAPVRWQQGLMTDEQRRVFGRHLVATVFAADDEGGFHGKLL